MRKSKLACVHSHIHIHTHIYTNFESLLFLQIEGLQYAVKVPIAVVLNLLVARIAEPVAPVDDEFVKVLALLDVLFVVNAQSDCYGRCAGPLISLPVHFETSAPTVEEAAGEFHGFCIAGPCERLICHNHY